MKRPNETFQERIDNKELTPLALQFILDIKTTAMVNFKTRDEIWKNWKQYSEDCQNSDQSACFPEFCQWYKLDDYVTYDEPVFNSKQVA